MIIENSRWISKFESDLDKKQIFCLYGNVDDNFFYDKSISNLKDFFDKKFKRDILYFFDVEHFEKILNEDESTDEEDEENNEVVPTGRDLLDFLKFVDMIKNSEKNYIIIKDPKLFFKDLCSDTTSYSLRYFLENIFSNEFEDKKIIFISEELGDFPEKLTVNNPYTSTLYIDYPEEDERKAYLETLDITNLFKNNTNYIFILLQPHSKR